MAMAHCGGSELSRAVTGTERSGSSAFHWHSARQLASPLRYLTKMALSYAASTEAVALKRRFCTTDTML
jgi:hypothetical protein